MTERMSATPMTTIVASPLTPVNAKPFFRSWIMASPMAAPQIVPEPPKMLVPPSTTAAITTTIPVAKMIRFLPRTIDEPFLELPWPGQPPR